MIEARAFEHHRPRNTGIGLYVAGLVRALGELDDTDRYSVVTVGRIDDGMAALAAPPTVRLRPLRLPARAFGWLQRRDRLPPLDLVAPRADVFLFTNFTTYRLRRTPYAVVVYDLTYLLAPETLNDAYRTRLTRNVPRAVAGAGAVIVVSGAVRDELVEHLAVPPGKIVVASPGVDGTVFRPVPADRRAEVRSRLGLPDRYFLFVGTLQPRKNVRRLLDAYAALPDATRAREGLVLAGMKGWRDDEIVAEIDRLRAAGERIHTPGYVDAADLPALYAGATALVWPSLYEGFGMPILEAMACGAPVITSARPAMAEAAGGAALLVDPTDVGALSGAMRRIAEDDALASTLARRGPERAARARWSDTAGRVREALALAASAERAWSPRGESNS